MWITDHNKKLDLRRYRIVFLIAVIVSPLISYKWKCWNPYLTSSLGMGWFISLLFLACLLGSFVSGKFRNNIIYSVYMLLLISTLSALYFAYVNKFHIEYTVVLLLTTYCVTIILNKPVLIAFYYLLISALLVIAINISIETYIKKESLIIIFMTIFAIHFLNVWLRSTEQLKIQNSEEKYRLLVTQMKQGLAVHEVICDEQGKVIDYRFLDINESFEAMTGLKKETIIGKTVLEILPETENYWIEKYAHVATTGQPIQYENYSKELGKYYESVAYSPRPQQFAVIITDISERKRLEKQMFDEKERFKTTLVSVGDGVISTDKHGNIELLNKVAEQLTGWAQADAFGRKMEDVFNIIDEFTREKVKNPVPVQTIFDSGKPFEFANDRILISKEGIERPIKESAAPIMDVDGNINGVVLVFRDFTEEKEKQIRIEHLSYHDQLTGLYNRRFYEEELKRLDTQRNLPVSVIMGDVNGLKLVNDAFGHDKGDELLKKAAEAIRSACRAEDIVARWGGDEFVILLPKTGAKEAEEIVNRIKEYYSDQYVNAIRVSIAFGWDTKNISEESILKVFKNAEDYMYKHKIIENQGMKNSIISTIIHTLHEKNPREEKHSQRVSDLCQLIGKTIGLSETEVSRLKAVGLLHDIGKIAIEDVILNKLGKLTDLEKNQIERHPDIGFRILNSAHDMLDIADGILAHHERWDGRGYPKGLIGEEIPRMARVIALADSYDAMTSERPYRKALSKKEVLEEIQENAGTQFDPDIARLFIEKVLCIGI